MLQKLREIFESLDGKLFNKSMMITWFFLVIGFIIFYLYTGNIHGVIVGGCVLVIICLQEIREYYINKRHKNN